MKNEYADNIVENIYLHLKKNIQDFKKAIVPYIRRTLRFFALPYCYFVVINWDECTASRLQVARDFIYIFFVLKYYPDNYSQCRLWEKDRKIWPYYYGSIYEPYQRARLRRNIQKEDYIILFEDKYICYQLCKASKLPLPQQYACVDTHEDFISIIQMAFNECGSNRIIVKPVMGKGGKGIVLIERKGAKLIVNNKGQYSPVESFKLHERSVMQEYVSQDDALSLISPTVNTVRIVSMLTNDRHVILLGAYMRFGIGDAYIDNVSAGGIEVGIDIEKGIFLKFAYNKLGCRFDRHPTSNFIFENKPVPMWSSVVNLVEKTQLVFSFYKLLGHDIAITKQGPVIIEINAEPDIVGLESACGPILRNPRVRNAFNEYDLLINKESKRI